MNADRDFGDGEERRAVHPVRDAGDRARGRIAVDVVPEGTVERQLLVGRLIRIFDDQGASCPNSDSPGFKEVRNGSVGQEIAKIERRTRLVTLHDTPLGTKSLYPWLSQMRLRRRTAIHILPPAMTLRQLPYG